MSLFVGLDNWCLDAETVSLFGKLAIIPTAVISGNAVLNTLFHMFNIWDRYDYEWNAVEKASVAHVGLWAVYYLSKGLRRK